MREVNIDKIQIDLGEYNEALVEREQVETREAVSIAKELNTKTKARAKVKKLDKKIELVPATEAVEDSTKNIEDAIEQEKKKQEQEKKEQKQEKKEQEKKKAKELDDKDKKEKVKKKKLVLKM